MKTLVILAAAAAGLALASPALAQPKAAEACPQLMVHSPDSVKGGETITMTAMVSGGDAEVTPTYNWSVSAGSIESGQGTSSIVIASPSEGGTTVTGTVEVGGYDRACSTANSSTTMVDAAG